jgi:hypothetical protein
MNNKIQQYINGIEALRENLDGTLSGGFTSVKNTGLDNNKADFMMSNAEFCEPEPNDNAVCTGSNVSCFNTQCPTSKNLYCTNSSCLSSNVNISVAEVFKPQSLDRS